MEKKREIVVLIMGLIVFSIVLLIPNKKEYKVEGKEIKEEKNINTIAMYKNDGETDIPITTMPSASEYEIDTEKSYCERGKEKLYNVLTNTENNFAFTTLQSSDKCYVWFNKKKTASEKTLDNLGLRSEGKLTEEFTGPSCDSSNNNTGCGQYNMNQNGLYESTDDDGTTYYFRGTVTNNYVKFGKTGSVKGSGTDMYWRIIRINGDGTIRMIYEGTTANANGDKNNTDSIAVGGQRWNIQDSQVYDDNKYVGLTWSDNQVRGYTTKSNVLKQLETWYTANLADEADLIDKDAGFCNDRQPSSSETEINRQGGTLKTKTYYGAYTRIIGQGTTPGTSKQKPSFKCSEKTNNYSNDLYTVRGAIKGNKQLEYPIGLITADEVSYAGGYHGQGAENYKYYLYNGQIYWTMSPFSFVNDYAFVFFVYIDGGFGLDNVNDLYVGVRPVINLKADTTFTTPGTGVKGSTTNPFTVS